MPILAHKGSKPICSGCGKKRTAYDHLPMRRFEFIPTCGCNAAGHAPCFLSGMTSKHVYFLLSAMAVASHGCSSISDACTDLGVILPMQYDAQLPAAFATTNTLELCIGALCDTASLVASNGSDAPKGLHVCRDIDGHTVNFPTSCVTDPTIPTTLHLNTDTSNGGHSGTDILVLTSIDASGTRTELLRGTVVFQDATTDSSREACGAPFYSGKFTADGK